MNKRECNCINNTGELCKKCKKYEYDILFRAKRKQELGIEFLNQRARENYHKRKNQDLEKHNLYLLNKKNYRIINKSKYMLRAAKFRAKVNNIPFNIDISDIIIPEYCPILGIKISLDERQGDMKGPSLDKIIPELGYIKGNIEVICRKANMMKLNCTFEELKLFSKNILKYIEKYE